MVGFLPVVFASGSRPAPWWAAVGLVMSTVATVVGVRLFLILWWEKRHGRLVNRRRSVHCECEVLNDRRADIWLRQAPATGRTADLECRVRDPDGNEAVFQMPELMSDGGDLMCSYPFQAAINPPRSGDFIVTWWRDGRRIAACGFTIPPGRPGWYTNTEPVRQDNRDGVLIRLYNTLDATFGGVECEVTGPDGQARKHVVAAGEVAGTEIVYPHDFPGAPDLVPGEYRVLWTGWEIARTLLREGRFSWP